MLNIYIFCMCSSFIVFVSLIVDVNLDYRNWGEICDERKGDCDGIWACVGFEGQQDLDAQKDSP